jgi:hypothetical protein
MVRLSDGTDDFFFSLKYAEQDLFPRRRKRKERKGIYCGIIKHF